MIKVGIIGMGALGHTLWVHLRAAGLRPVILSRRMYRFPPGARLRTAGVAVPAPLTPEDLYAGEDLDVLFVTWNLQDNDQLPRCIDPRAVRWVVSLQNGLTKNTSLQASFPEATVLRGCTGLAVSQAIDGTTTVTHRSGTFIEERVEALGPLEELVSSFAFGGLRLKLVNDAAACEHTRLGLHVAFEPLCALTMMSQQKLWTSPPLAEQAVQMLREFDGLIGAAGGRLSTDPEWGFDLDLLLRGSVDDAVNSLAAKGRSLLRPSDPPILAALAHSNRPRTRIETQVIFESLLELARTHHHPIPHLVAAYEAVCALAVEPRR